MTGHDIVSKLFDDIDPLNPLKGFSMALDKENKL